MMPDDDETPGSDGTQEPEENGASTLPVGSGKALSTVSTDHIDPREVFERRAAGLPVSVKERRVCVEWLYNERLYSQAQIAAHFGLAQQMIHKDLRAADSPRAAILKRRAKRMSHLIRLQDAAELTEKFNRLRMQRMLAKGDANLDAALASLEELSKMIATAEGEGTKEALALIGQAREGIAKAKPQTNKAMFSPEFRASLKDILEGWRIFAEELRKHGLVPTAQGEGQMPSVDQLRELAIRFGVDPGEFTVTYREVREQVRLLESGE